MILNSLLHFLHAAFCARSVEGAGGGPLSRGSPFKLDMHNGINSRAEDDDGESH
jgi:hypothetical protein